MTTPDHVEPGAVKTAEPAPRPPMFAGPLGMLQQVAGNRAVASLFSTGGGPAPSQAQAPVSLDDEKFNAGSRAHDLVRAIDSTEHNYRTVGNYPLGAEDVEAERRKVDFNLAVSALDGLTASQVSRVAAEFLAFDKIDLQTALFGGGTSGRKADLTDDQRARLEVLMRGTKAEPFPPAEMERMRAYPQDVVDRLLAAREQGAKDNRLEAQTIELHELLSKDPDGERRERIMALLRRPEDTKAIDALYLSKFGALENDLTKRLKGLQKTRAIELLFGNVPQADALAIEDKRRQIEELNKQDAEAGEADDFSGMAGGYSVILKQKRAEERRKLTGDINAIIELNKAEALTDENSAGRSSGEVVADRLGKILGQQHGDPGNTLGAELDKTLGKEDAAAIRALTDRWNVAGSANLIEAAAGQLAADERAGKTSAKEIIAQMRSFRELALRDLKVEAPNLPPDQQQELLSKPDAAVSRRAQQYIERYRNAYDGLRGEMRSFDKIVASADAADEMLIGALSAHGEASDVIELRHSIAKKDVTKVKEVLRRQKDDAAIRALISGYNALGEGRDLSRDLFGQTVEGATATSAQAQSNEMLAAMGGLVRARDAAQVGELLAKPGADQGAQAKWLTEGGVNEFDVTMAHRGLTGDMRAWGDDPETQQLLERTRDDLRKMNEQFATVTDPAEKERLLREMRRLRSTLTGDADAYEADNARMLAQIQSALSFAVSIALAIAIPGAGAGIVAFMQTAAINIAATVASNFVIKMGDYSLDDLKADVLGGALGAGGAKFGEELMGRVASAVLRPSAEAAASAAGKAGVTTVLSREVGSIAGAGEKVIIEAAEFEAKAGARAVVVVGAREVGGFAGGMYAPKVLTGDYGLTVEEVLKALAGTVAGKAAGKYRERAAAKKAAESSSSPGEEPAQRAQDEEPAQRAQDEEPAQRTPEEDGGALPTGAFHPEPVPANADVFGPRSPKQMLLDNGIPVASADGFQQVADVLNVVIKVRPTNTASLDVLAGGGVPKPEIIKAKTVNRVDLLIGGPKDGLGKVGFFEPAMPPKDVLDVLLPAERQAVETRYNERLTEYQTYREEYSGLAAEGMLQLEGGTIKIVDPRTGKFNEIGGDHDLFEITGPDGRPISDDVRRGVVNLLRSMGINVEHGDHVSWPVDSPGTHDTKADQGIRDRHATSEPLVAFVPKGQPREVMAGDAVTGPERTEGPGDRHLPAAEGWAKDPEAERGTSSKTPTGTRKRTSQSEDVDPAAHAMAPDLAKIRDVWHGIDPIDRAKLLILAVHKHMAVGTGLPEPTVAVIAGKNSRFNPKDWHVDIGLEVVKMKSPTIEEFAAACDHARHEMEHVLIEFRTIRLEAQVTNQGAKRIAARWEVNQKVVERAIQINKTGGAEPLTLADQQTQEFRDLLHGKGAKDYRKTVDQMGAADAALEAAKAAVDASRTPETEATLAKAQNEYNEASKKYLELPDEMVAWPAGEEVLKAVEQYLDLNERLAKARDEVARLRSAAAGVVDEKMVKQLSDAITSAEYLIKFASEMFQKRGQEVP